MEHCFHPVFFLGKRGAMAKVLVVEGTKFFQQLLTQKLALAGFEVVTAPTLAAMHQALDEPDADLFVAIIDHDLPGAAPAKAIEEAVQRGIPVLALVSAFVETVREHVQALPVIDYMVKDDPSCLDGLVTMVGRLWQNRSIKALVVDDAAAARHAVAQMLRLFLFQVEEAGDGAEALDIIDSQGDIQLVITDYHMPHVDGFQLVRSIRRTYSRQQVAVIGMGQTGLALVAARFLKAGANDFIIRPFQPEELFCRVQMNVDMLGQLAELREAVTTDFMTGLRNRRSFFEVAGPLFAAARRGQAKVTLALVDVDNLSAINQQYGQDLGDVLLAGLAEVLAGQVRATDVLARLSGDVFCVLALNIPERDGVVAYFDRLCRQIANAPVETPSGLFNMTVSIGICDNIKGTLDEMIVEADTQLLAAKRNGRNQVMITE